ncbi:MAG TPA: hypothetical protein VJY34_20330 [Roseiarcus sp.]|nr:hypothetical protein [Roseiarcus sp.]
MLKTFALIGLGAAMSLTPLPAFAQTTPAPAAAVMHHPTAHKPTGSHGSEMRKRHTAARERTMAGAEHMRKMRTHNMQNMHNP